LSASSSVAQSGVATADQPGGDGLDLPAVAHGMAITRSDGTFSPGASRQQRLAEIGEILLLANPLWPGTVTQEQFDRTLASWLAGDKKRSCPTAKHARLLPGSSRPVPWERLREMAIAGYFGAKPPQDGITRAKATPDLDEDEARWALRMVHRRHATRLGVGPDQCRLGVVAYDWHAADLAKANGGSELVPSRSRIMRRLDRDWDDCLRWAGCWVTGGERVRPAGAARVDVILAALREFSVAPRPIDLPVYATSRNVALARPEAPHDADVAVAVAAFEGEGGTLVEPKSSEQRPDFASFPSWPADLPRPTERMPPARGQHTRAQLIDAVEQFDDWRDGPDAPSGMNQLESYMYWSEQQPGRPSYVTVSRAGGLHACLAEVERRRRRRVEPPSQAVSETTAVTPSIAVGEVSELDEILRDRASTLYPELIRFAQRNSTFTISEFAQATGFRPSTIQPAVSRLVAMRVFHTTWSGTTAHRPVSLIAHIAQRTEEILDAALPANSDAVRVRRATDKSLRSAERLAAAWEVCEQLKQPFGVLDVLQVLDCKPGQVYRDLALFKKQARLVVEPQLHTGRGRAQQRFWVADRAPRFRSVPQQVYDIAATLDTPFSVEQFADASGLSVTGAGAHLRSLVRAGCLTVTQYRKPGNNGQPRHLYSCTDRQPDQGEDSP
jgi:hypothetical protein